MASKGFLTAMLVAILLIVSCSNKGNDPNNTNQPPRELTTAEKQLVSSGNRFGLKFFKEIVRSEGDKNVFISPLSVAMALGMAYNGANSTTRDAMQNTLELQGMSLEDVNKSYRSVIDLLRGLDPKVKFTIANSIWYREGFNVEQPFIDLNQTYFDAVVRSLDFTDPAALAAINGWVNDNTGGKITQVLDRIPDYALMYLINAIYFKGTWKIRFDPARTGTELFHLPDQSTVPCQMMSLPETKIYSMYTRQFQAVDLKYGNGDYSMTIMVPYSNMNLDSVMAQLTDENWATWMSQFEQRDMQLMIPKIEIEWEQSLKEVLSTLGMGIAFTELADFSSISHDVGLMITEVKHKTYVKVDEEGTEAAAATSVEIGPTSGPAIFIADHPYLFIIHENHSGTILFMGKVVDPTRKTM